MERWGKPPRIDRNSCPSHNRTSLALPRLVSCRRVGRKEALISVSLGNDEKERLLRSIASTADDPKVRQTATSALDKLEKELFAKRSGSATADYLPGAEKAAKEKHRDEVSRDCTACPEMVMVPAGVFDMGSNTGSDDEKPGHRVNIRSFEMGKTEVTQGQWQAVMGSNPSRFDTSGDDFPVEHVSWQDVQKFLRKLNQATGKAYRLPSEAEWEYACRAGGTYEYCGAESAESVDSVSWHRNNTNNAPTHLVGTKAANAWGLYDMSGNVWEWTDDCWNAGYTGAPSDGSAWTNGDCTLRVVRGGSWRDDRKLARSTVRVRFATSRRSADLGFRVARTLP